MSSVPLSSINSQQQWSTGHEPPPTVLYIHNTTSEAVCVVVPAAAVGMEAGLDSLSLQSVQAENESPSHCKYAKIFNHLQFEVDPISELI